MRCSLASSSLGLLLLCAPSLKAETLIDGGEFGEAIWTAAESPYLITLETSYEKLTIEAGTTVLFDAEHPVGLHLNATDLLIQGTSEAPVVFDADAEPETPNWRVVAERADVTGALMTRAWTALTVFTEGAVRQSRFEDCTWGIEALSADLTVDSVTTLRTGLGIFFSGASITTLHVANSLFLQSDLDGIACNAGTCFITHSTFDQNQYGIYADAQAIVRNSIFSNNAWGLQAHRDSLDIANCNFWQNNTDVGLPFTADEAATLSSLFVDPAYVSESDWHLAPGSACVDAVGSTDASDHDRDGNPRPQDGDGIEDEDGTVFDLGAYEYQPDVGGSGGAAPGVGGAGAAGLPVAPRGGAGGDTSGAAGDVSTDGRSVAESGGSAGSAGDGFTTPDPPLPTPDDAEARAGGAGTGGSTVATPAKETESGARDTPAMADADASTASTSPVGVGLVDVDERSDAGNQAQGCELGAVDDGGSVGALLTGLLALGTATRRRSKSRLPRAAHRIIPARRTCRSGAPKKRWLRTGAF